MKSNFTYRFLAIFVLCALFLTTNAQNSNQNHLEQKILSANDNGEIYDEVVIKSTLTKSENKFELKNFSFEIFPSPAVDYIIINSDLKDYSECKFTIYSADGKIISEGILNESKRRVELKNASPGNYLVSLTKENESLCTPMNFSIVN